MTLDELLALPGLEEARAAFEPHWEESAATFPAQVPDFLKDEEIISRREYAALDPAMDETLLAAAARVRQDPKLLELAWHSCCLLWEHWDYTSQQMATWPELTGEYAGVSGPLWIIIALECVPRTIAKHTEMGVPDAITRTSVSRMWETVNAYRVNHDGAWGYQPAIFYWLRLYVEGVLFGLTRLEFMIRPFQGKVKVFRHRTSGLVVALSLPDLYYTPEGFLNAGDTPETAPDGWLSTYEETDDAASGYVVTPNGRATHRRVRLPLSDWEVALQQGDPTFDIHIPAGGNMTPELCRQSMAEAIEFFPKYFPDKHPRAFACYSWILNPELADWFDPESNMVKWQREMYLMPWPSGGRDGLYFIFGRADVDPATGPRDTRLRRAVLDRLAAGERLRVSGVFMLVEDFAHYGEQIYLSQDRSGLEEV